MSLLDVSNRTGISVSTLSKIENNLIELNYTRMMAISEGLGINLTELVTVGHAMAPTPPIVTARRSLTRVGAGAVTETKNYVYEYLNTDISKKHMIPTVATVKPRTLAEYGEFATHRGEEFVIILDGEVEFHTEHYEPVKLAKGDSVYIDSTMPHAMISISQDLARILFVCTHAIPEEQAAAVEVRPIEAPPKQATARARTRAAGSKAAEKRPAVRVRA